MKQCSKCKCKKNEAEFYKKRSAKDGLESSCKKCTNERNRSWVVRNREASNAVKQKYKVVHREKYLAQQREYAKERYEEDPERAKKIHKKWVRENPETYKKSYSDSYYKHREKNAEKAKANVRKWQKENPERTKELREKTKKKNIKKVRVRGLVDQRISTGKLKPNETCEMCKKKCKTHAHHEDYDKPLDIKWLCTACHGKIHSKYFYK